MKKSLVFLFVLVMLMTACTISAFAEQAEYFYVNSESGNDQSEGTSPDSAVKTFTQACRFAEASGADKAYIVITNEYAMPATATEIAHAVPFVITTNDKKTDYAATNGAKLVFGKNLRYVLNGDTTFENIAIDYTGTLNCVAQYNHITFGDNVTTTRADRAESGIYIVGGWQSPTDERDSTLDTHITIKSGDFLNVIGGCRQRASGGSGLTLTGTHYIDVYGGTIVNLYGASVEHNWSQNAVITIAGGKTQNLFTGGDLSRRLNGSATVMLTGGEVTNANINNVVGNADVSLLGTKVGALSVSYYNTGVSQLAADAKSKKTLTYNGHYYTESQLASFTGFDVLKNATVVYAKADASGDGSSESTPASFEDGLKTAARTESSLVVIGKITLNNFTEPAHETAVTVTGIDDSASLEIKGTYTLSGDTAFDGIKLGGSGAFDATGGALTVKDTVTFAGGAKFALSGSAHLYTGKYTDITDAGKVIISGADVNSITGSTSATEVEIHAGNVGTVKTTDQSIDSFALTVSGGNIDKIVFNNVASSLSYTLVGGSIGKYEVSGTNAKGVLHTGEQLYAETDLGEAASLFSMLSEKVFFLADGEAGSGASANSPSNSIEAAYAALSDNGGTIVICGQYTLAGAFNSGANLGKITITSLYDGVDYAATNGAMLVLPYNFYLGGETEFDNITLKNGAHYRSIYANTYKLVIGDNVTTLPDDEYGSYLSIMGGNQAAIHNNSTDVTINSGTWQRVRGGTAAGGSTDLEVNLTVNGGEFVDILTLGSSLSHDGDITVTINGGTFREGIYASTLTGADHTFNSNVTLVINGGTVHKTIAPRNSETGSYSGTYNLWLFGGNFGHIIDIVGTDGVGSMTSTLYVSEDIDLSADIKGTMSFTNPIRSDGADPWLFYCDGYYYYTATTGSTVKLAKAANIGDLPYIKSKVIYDPEDGHEWSRNLWSPEIHYYSDEEIGEGNGGWYLFIACDDGHNINHRMYVAKCLDGNNLFGRWGNPVTGEVNVPERVSADEVVNFDNIWAAGMSEVRINGKLYMLYITETGRGTADFYQTINIIEMTNPWTIIGQPSVICYPQYDWEKGGYAYNEKTGDGTPMVVEGSTAVYADDGTVYLIYSGSGYWTTMYCLAQLKYIGGDPLKITSWEKLPEPILSKSNNINGCGHASYVTDTSGQDWVCYHAYIGNDTSSGRYAFVEPYYADKNGVVIADGSRKPADIDKVYTVDYNPLPLAKRTSGFDKIETAKAAFASIRDYVGAFTDVTENHWFYSYVENAYELGLVKGTSDVTFSPDDTFTVAAAITVAANIHTAYNNTAVRAASAGEKWYTPYVKYCVQNGIITERQFTNFDDAITRGDMAIVFANILPRGEYGTVKSGSNPDVTSDMACYDAVGKLYRAGIVGGDADTGNYRPSDSIKRSEACVIFTRIAMKTERAY